jgi:hypothetical protein
MRLPEAGSDSLPAAPSSAGIAADKTSGSESGGRSSMIGAPKNKNEGV